MTAPQVSNDPNAPHDFVGSAIYCRFCDNSHNHIKHLHVTPRVGTPVSNARADVLYRTTLDGTEESMGDVESSIGWLAKVLDFYGYDYIVRQDNNGRVTAERFDHIDIDDGGYFTPVERAWAELAAAEADDHEDEDTEPRSGLALVIAYENGELRQAEEWELANFVYATGLYRSTGSWGRFLRDMSAAGWSPS